MKSGYEELELARVQVDPSRYPVAEARFRDALRIGGADAFALRGLAGLAAARHRFDESLELAQRAQKLDPGNAAVYGLIGDASLELGRFPQAIEAFDRMMSLKPTPSGYARVSYARELLGERDGAIEAMQLSAEAAGHSEPAAWALTHLGNLHVGIGRACARRAAVPCRACARARLRARARRSRGRRATARRREHERNGCSGERSRESTIRAHPQRWATSSPSRDARRRRSAGMHARSRSRRSLPATAVETRSRPRCSTSTTTGTSPTRSSARGSACVFGPASRVFTPTRGRCTRTVVARKRFRTRTVRSRSHPTDTGALYHRSLIESCLGNGEAAARYAARVRSLDPTFLAPSAFRVR